ncbi:MAG: hypothetical protein CVU07_01140 [Bacteroidetes bacterium HGW-Bacteroidetes-23]|nr:MAG: hypothetical protein CVU07_01140 [Bacteroidetes bacterium HGW-Bacteroidetes-23]
MEKVIFKNEVLLYLDELIYQLFEDEYFSYPENAVIYVNKIVDFTINEISTFPHKKTPFKLKNLGSRYIFYKSNSRTTWYLFFENHKNKILITGILNNHSPLANDIK